jgi:hypothetical protein
MKSQIYYTSVIDRSSESIQRIKKQAQILLYGKVLSFGLFVLFVILWINDVTLTLSVSGTIVFLGSYLLFSIWDYRLSLKLSKLEKIIKVCTNEMNFKKGVFCGDDGKRFINPDHPFSYDIDVFGTNSLFHRINRTITDEGAIKLAKILSETGIGENIITERQRAIKELENNSDFRIDFLCENLRGKYFSSIMKDMSQLSNLNVKFQYVVWFLWTIMGLSIIYLAISLMYGGGVNTAVYILYGILSFNGLLSVFFLHRGGKIMQRIDTLISIGNSYDQVTKICETTNFKSAILKSAVTDITRQKEILPKLRNMSELLNFRNNFIFWVVSNSVVLLDIFVLLKYTKLEKEIMKQLPDLIDRIGLIDAFVSLSSYCFLYNDEVYPQYIDNGIEAIGLRHPFIPNSVANNYSHKEALIQIITGANMSGKSTFLRAVSLNLLLANAGCRVFASSFVFNPNLRLFSSMRTHDDIILGKSYFNAEIERLSQAIDYCHLNAPVLLILDEILKGTNSEDKLDGSLKLLKYFSKNQLTVICATHDIGITDLELNQGSDKFQNYCFEIELTDPIIYTYKISRGVCSNRNASYLIAKNLLSK